MNDIVAGRHAEDREITFLTGTYMPIPQLPRLRAAGAPIELDLGCGAGSFTTALARRYPERTILAADVMVGRLRKLVKRCHREEVDNVVCFRTEARHLLALALPDGLLTRIHLLCPDPWPKGRHRGNRLLSSNFTAQLYRVLTADGVFHFSSDDDYYTDAVARIMAASPLFAAAAADPLLADIKSDFELRHIAAGKRVRHLYYRKK